MERGVCNPLSDTPLQGKCLESRGRRMETIVRKRLEIPKGPTLPRSILLGPVKPTHLTNRDSPRRVSAWKLNGIFHDEDT